MAEETKLLNTCTLQATGYLLKGEKIRARLYEGEYDLFIPKGLLGRLKSVDGLLKLVCYPRTTAVGNVKLTLARFASAEVLIASRFHAVGKIRYSDCERAALRIYPNPKGNLKRPFTVQLAHSLENIPTKQPVEVWGGLKGEHLTLESFSVLEQLPPRDESYKEKRGRR